MAMQCFIIIVVLKAVETVGYKYTRGSDDYNNALNNDLLALRKQGIMRGISRRVINSQLFLWFLHSMDKCKTCIWTLLLGLKRLYNLLTGYPWSYNWTEPKYPYLHAPLISLAHTPGCCMFQPDRGTLSGPNSPSTGFPSKTIYRWHRFRSHPDNQMRTNSAAVFVQIYWAHYKVIAVAAAYVMLCVSVNRIANCNL